MPYIIDEDEEARIIESWIRFNRKRAQPPTKSVIWDSDCFTRDEAESAQYFRWRTIFGGTKPLEWISLTDFSGRTDFGGSELTWFLNAARGQL